MTAENRAISIISPYYSTTKYSPALESFIYNFRRGKKYIYFVLASDLGLIKIGKSYVPQDRVRGLTTGCPSRLDIIATIPVTNTVTEGRIHKAFVHLRTSSRREWFRAGEDLIQFILMIKSGKDYVSRLKEIELSQFAAKTVKSARGKAFLYQHGIIENHNQTKTTAPHPAPVRQGARDIQATSG